MNRISMSRSASALFRALIARAGVPRDRVLLADVNSIDWQSLTFTGERHQIEVRVTGPSALTAVERMCAGLEDAEFDIAGIIVADINVVGAPGREPDGSVTVAIEALTVSED